MNHVTDLFLLLQILLIDLSMAGDNALVVGMAAAGLPMAKRHMAVAAGVAGATVLRIVFAVFAVKMLQITGILAAGGLLLLWVGWKMYEELQHAKAMKGGKGEPESQPRAAKTMVSAIWQITAADISMSLDNVLGIAGVARDHIGIMVIGLIVSVLLMGLASTYVARLAARHNWVGYVGLGVVLITAAKMVWDGVQPLIGS